MPPVTVVLRKYDFVTQRSRVVRSCLVVSGVASTDMVFLDLPLEILPEIFSHTVKSQDLASLCLVNKCFRAFAVSRLYERVSIYSWHKDGKSKACSKNNLKSLVLNNILQVIKLFGTFSHYPHLALLVFCLGKSLKYSLSP